MKQTCVGDAHTSKDNKSYIFAWEFCYQKCKEKVN